MTTRRHLPPPQPNPAGPNPSLMDEGTPPLMAPTPPGQEPEEWGPPPGAGEDRHLVGDQGPAAAPVVEHVELSPEEQIMFASLLTCGRRSKTIRLFDHTVVVQTLCCDDDLRVGLYAKDFVGSLGEQRAYQVAVAAAGIRTIDGRPVVEGLFEQVGDDALFDQKVLKVASMYPHVVNRIYRAILEAEQEFIELSTKLGKFDG